MQCNTKFVGNRARLENGIWQVKSGLRKLCRSADLNAFKRCRFTIKFFDLWSSQEISIEPVSKGVGCMTILLLWFVRCLLGIEYIFANDIDPSLTYFLVSSMTFMVVYQFRRKTFRNAVNRVESKIYRAQRQCVPERNIAQLLPIINPKNPF